MMLQAANFRFKGSSKADTTADIRHYVHTYTYSTQKPATQKKSEREMEINREKEKKAYFLGG